MLSVFTDPSYFCVVLPFRNCPLKSSCRKRGRYPCSVQVGLGAQACAPRCREPRAFVLRVVSSRFTLPLKGLLGAFLALSSDFLRVILSGSKNKTPKPPGVTFYLEFCAARCFLTRGVCPSVYSGPVSCPFTTCFPSWFCVSSSVSCSISAGFCHREWESPLPCSWACYFLERSC